jgi:murein DD-endopeptidase MepM/ murein hydrolase activator NlpD
MERTQHLEGLLIVILLIGLGGLYLWQNYQPSVTVSVPAATPTSGDAPAADWQIALEAQLALAGTPLPTPDMGMAFVPPTLPPTAYSDASIVDPGQIQVTPWPTPTFRPTNPPPTPFGPTPFPSPTGVFEADSSEELGFQPPPEEVPLSAHANDHYWLVRPVDASANSESLFNYPYGSDGPTNDWRVHHGVDIPNDVGEPIHAGGAGTVIFAGDGATLVEARDLDVYPSYGLVVVIQHDFGYRGQKIYTLYAHMAAILVQKNQHVEAGDVIGLIGGTGDVSGPHVHMEVRLGENKYFSAYNPLLWIAPYLGYGVVAGRVTGRDGQLVEDYIVTLTQRGRVVQTTTTYIKTKRPGQVRDWATISDPGWQENFVMSDVLEGEYEISLTMYGTRISQTINVTAGTTNFVTLGWEAPATPQPVGDDES